MTTEEQKVFEQLISDQSFIDWASGDNQETADYWLQWKSTNLDYVTVFDDALKTAKLFKFNKPQLRHVEISYQLKKTEDKLSSSTKSSKRSIYYWSARVAAILVIPFLIAIIFLYSNNKSLKEQNSYLAELESRNIQIITAPPGARLSVKLPDGSQVWLNSGSSLKYPLQFNTTKREVELEGEAYFKVEKSTLPFHVKNNGPEVKVYGTEFNVFAYKKYKISQVALVSGKVSLISNGEENFLNPGQVGSYNKKKEKLRVFKANIKEYTCWREGKFIFEDRPLNFVLRKLEHRFNTEIILKSPELGNHPYIGEFDNQSLIEIIDLLSLSAPINYEYTKAGFQEDGSYSRAKLIITKDNSRIIKQ